MRIAAACFLTLVACGGQAQVGSRPSVAPVLLQPTAPPMESGASTILVDAAVPKPAVVVCELPKVLPENAVRSPDGKLSVFVEVDESREDETAVGAVPHARLCVCENGLPVRVLLEGRGTPDATPQSTLASFGELVLSPDQTTLYFTTAAWVTSGAAHAIDLRTGRERFLFDGTVAAVIENGPYRGMLLASHFRLDPLHRVDSPKYRGRVETWTVESPDGKTLRSLPEDSAAREKALAGR